ncbi:hypothetical protein [Nisaea sp.]|uniref:hypothetical protein n=1 Tax=Nisaea sp. TaxID=2024842 RepID=UPI00326345BA
MSLPLVRQVLCLLVLTLLGFLWRPELLPKKTEAVRRFARPLPDRSLRLVLQIPMRFLSQGLVMIAMLQHRMMSVPE